MHREEIVRRAVVVDYHQRLCCGILEQCTTHVEIEREHGRHILGQRESALFGNGNSLTRQVDFYLQVGLVMTVEVMVLGIDKEQEAASVGRHAGGITQVVTVVGCHGLHILGHYRLHGSKQVLEVAKEIVNDTQRTETGSLQPKLTERRLEIITYLGQSHRLVAKELAAAAIHARSGTTVIHVVADYVRPTCKAAQHQCFGCLGSADGTLVIHHLYAHAHLGRCRRVVERIVAHRAVVGRGPQVLEHAEVALALVGEPSGISVTRSYRYGLAGYHRGVAPPGGSVKRGDDTRFLGNAEECLHVLVAKVGGAYHILLHRHAELGYTLVITCGSEIKHFLAGIVDGPRCGRVLMLVFELATDDGAAILVIKPRELLGNLVIQFTGIFKILGVVTANVEILGKNPVGNTARAYFTMPERAYAHNYVHPVLATQFDEMP